MPKIYGSATIERHCNQALKSKDYSGSGSIANQRHDDSREAARRRRQMEKAKK